MEKAIWKQAAERSFWESYAPWYEQWLEHNTYHQGVLRFLHAVTKPEWKVLDIGAGSGILSLPLSRRGCHVTALEPSRAMRQLFYQRVRQNAEKVAHIDGRAWEEVPKKCYRNYDFVVACNSLHLTPMGFEAALAKVLHHGPKRVLVVSELVSPQMKIPLMQNGYVLCYGRVDKIKSSFVYHNVEEATHHWSIMNSRHASKKDIEVLNDSLMRNGEHLRMADEALVGMYYWKRKDSILRYREKRTSGEKTIHRVISWHHHKPISLG